MGSGRTRVPGILGGSNLLFLPIKRTLIDNNAVKGPRFVRDTNMQDTSRVWFCIGKNGVLEKGTMHQNENTSGGLVAMPMGADHLPGTSGIFSSAVFTPVRFLNSHNMWPCGSR